MIHRLFFCFILTLVGTCALAQNPTPFTEASFRELSGRYMKDPIAFFEKDCTADFVSIGAEGKRGSLESHKNMFQNFVCDKRDFEDLVIRQYGPTGVMTGIATSVYKRKDGSTFTQKDYYTQLFVWQNGGWKMAGYQATALDGRLAKK